MKASTFLPGMLVLFCITHNVPSLACADLVKASPEKKKQTTSKATKKSNPFLSKPFFMSKYSYSL